MCTNPRIITNPTRTFQKGITKMILEVPCGQCDQCREELSTDWFTRMYTEILTYKHNGGCTIFTTLTYRNSCLPTLKDAGMVIPGFNPKDKNRFLNSLRKRLERDGIQETVKYMWVCEYGMQTGATHRPHYHVLLHFPKSAYEYYGISNLKHMIEEYWSFGLVRWSKDKLGSVVSNDYAARYVSKYCVKDIAYFNQPQVNAYLYNDKGEIIKTRWEKFKNYRPRHWQSKSYGLELYNELIKNKNIETYILDGIKLDTIKDLRQGKQNHTRIPKYILNKIMYTTIEDGRRTLTNKGIWIQTTILKQRLQKECQKIENKIINYPDELKQELLEKLNNRSILEYLLYKKVWQGRVITDKKAIERLNKLNKEEYIKESINKYLEDLNFDISTKMSYDGGYFRHIRDSNKGEEKLLKMKFYTTAERFKGFDELQQLMNKYDSTQDSARLAAKVQKQEYIHELKYKLGV